MTDCNESFWAESLEFLDTLGIDAIVNQASIVTDSLFSGFWILAGGRSEEELCLGQGLLPTDIELGSYCRQIINTGALLVVQEIFYGVPVSIPGKGTVGVLCSVQSSPQCLSVHQISCLEALAQQVALKLQLNLLMMESESKDVALREMNRLANLGKFSMFFAHEINNGLSLINGCSVFALEICAERGESTPEIIKQLNMIQRGQARIKKIVDGIKAYTRRSPVNPSEPILISELFQMIHNLVSDHCRLEDIDLKLSSYADGIHIDCCPTEICQVLLNLIHNAIDAIEGQNEKWIKVEAKSISKGVEFSVTDSGSGIPEELASKIMDPFFTTKKRGQGTGLGLAISQDIIKNHKGSISVDRSCQNTRFVFVIPLN